jgi:hypothetical protein
MQTLPMWLGYISLFDPETELTKSEKFSETAIGDDGSSNEVRT